MFQICWNIEKIIINKIKLFREYNIMIILMIDELLLFDNILHSSTFTKENFNVSIQTDSIRYKKSAEKWNIRIPNLIIFLFHYFISRMHLVSFQLCMRFLKKISIHVCNNGILILFSKRYSKLIFLNFSHNRYVSHPIIISS